MPSQQAVKTGVDRGKAHWSDSRLIRECLEGSETAWSVLIEKYKNLIFSIPIRYGFSQDDSADIFQSVCMDLLADLPRIREPNALAGWLIQVTRNKCFHRKQEQLRHPAEEIDEKALPGVENRSDAIILQVQQEQLLREALRGLPSRCKRLVQLLFFESPILPYEEVAKMLGLATGSIGLVRRRCLDKLRRNLEDAGI